MALKTKSSILDANKNIESLILTEGFNISPVIGSNIISIGSSASPVNSNTSTDPNSASFFYDLQVVAGRCFFIKKIYISTTQTVTIDVRLDDSFNSGKITFLRKRVFANTTEEFEINAFMHGNSRVRVSQFEGDGTAIQMRGSCVAYDITDDCNYLSSKKILFVGDSIQYGANVGAFQSYLPSDIYTFKIRDYYKNKNIDTRAVVLSTHGITTQLLDRERLNSKFDSQKWDLIVYSASTNNTISGGTSEQIAAQLSEATANFSSFINWKKTTQPSSKLLMLGPPPLFNTSRESQLVTLRSAMQSRVTAIGDSKTYYLSLGNAYVATDMSNYSETAPADGVHPNRNANNLMFQLISPFLDSNIPTI